MVERWEVIRENGEVVKCSNMVEVWDAVSDERVTIKHYIDDVCNRMIKDFTKDELAHK